MLRREVEVPRSRWAMPTCPIAALVAVLMLSWVSALSAPRTSSEPRPRVERLRPCPERKAERPQPAPAPVATEHDCEFGELLDCNYGGHRR